MYTDFLLEPASGTFDVPAIEAMLAEVRIAVRDEQVPNEFMVFDDASEARRTIEQRRTTSGVPYSAALVQLDAHRISVAYRGGGVAPLRAFVTELARRFTLVYRDEAFADLSSSFDPDLDFLFGPEP